MRKKRERDSSETIGTSDLIKVISFSGCLCTLNTAIYTVIIKEENKCLAVANFSSIFSVIYNQKHIL